MFHMKISSLLSICIILSVYSSSVSAEEQTCPRIISQSPYISEMLDYLGLGKCIVGVSRYSKRDLPRTGGISDPNAEEVDALMPDLIITSSWTKEKILKQVTPEGVKAIRFKSFNKMEQLENNMKTIIQATNWHKALPKVESFAKAWRQKVKLVEGNNKKVLLLSACSGKPYSFGPNSRLHDLFTRAGFNVVETREKIHHIRPGNEVESLSELADHYQPDLLIIFEQKLKKQCQLIAPKVPVRIISFDGKNFLHPNTAILKGLDFLIEKKSIWAN